MDGLNHNSAWMVELDDRQVASRVKAMDGLNQNSLGFASLNHKLLVPGFILHSLTGFTGIQPRAKLIR